LYILILHVFGVDATECSSSEFSCKTRDGPKCLPNMYKCDQVQDCDDNEDERDCPGS
jgi:hypothetical protein